MSDRSDPQKDEAPADPPATDPAAAAAERAALRLALGTGMLRQSPARSLGVGLAAYSRPIDATIN